MKRYMLFAAAALAATGLILSGCEKKTETKTEPAKTDTVATPDVKEPTADVAKPEPKPIGDVADKTVDLAKAMAKATEDVDTSKAPEYLKKLVGHMTEFTKVIKDNMDDCQKTVDAVNKYVEENEKELAAIQKEAQEAKAKMSEEESKEVSMQTMKLMQDVFKESMAVHMQFTTKCKTESKKISEAMKRFKVK
ncbi:MAG: hypothetical protein JXR96_30220 [Deltaproteobacteria bacterium]|nr:hypothetical protein [Deltaproteobacteria bacterium]